MQLQQNFHTIKKPTFPKIKPVPAQQIGPVLHEDLRHDFLPHKDFRLNPDLVSRDFKPSGNVLVFVCCFLKLRRILSLSSVT